MTRTLAAALAAAAVLAYALPAQALAVTHTVVPAVTDQGPAGATCGMTAVPDLTPGGAGLYDAELHAGPMVLVTFGDPTSIWSGSITCTVQTGTNDTYSEPNAAPPVTGGHSTAVATLAGTTSYAAGEDDPVWLCTAVNLNGGGTLYWDDVNATWTTDQSARCALAISAEPGPVPVHDFDPIICPILSIVFPPEGDIVLPVAGKVWDCPPYDV